MKMTRKSLHNAAVTIFYYRIIIKKGSVHSGVVSNPVGAIRFVEMWTESKCDVRLVSNLLLLPGLYID